MSTHKALSAFEIIALQDKIVELQKFVVEVRDTILYPLAHDNHVLAAQADGLGQATVELLK